MLPLIVDPARVSIALVGQGDAFDRRLAMLREAGARDIAVYTVAPAPALRGAEDVRLHDHWPDAPSLARFHIVYVAGLPRGPAAALDAAARAGGALVNVEDVKDLCDFHVPARIHRGDLLITVSTGGRSPGLAVWLKRWIAARIGTDWAGRLDILANGRTRWRREGADLADRLARTGALIDREGWLDAEAPPRPAARR